MNASVSVLLVGAGGMSARHARILRAVAPRARVSVASRSIDKAREFARRHGLAGAFGDYRDAIHSDCDVVVIAVPPLLHAELADACLHAEKHILLEKPAFQSLEEFDALLPRLQETRRTVMVAENDHFNPFYSRMRRRVARGDLGRPLILRLQRLGRHPVAGWRADTTHMPWGALHEGGVHWIRRLLRLATACEPAHDATVVGVRAYASRLGDVPGEDTMLVVARHRCGLVSELVHSWSIPRRFGPWQVSGLILTRGQLWFDSRGLGALLVADEPRRRAVLAPVLRDAEGYRAMWRHFLSCVADGEMPDFSIGDARTDFAFLDAAYRSASAGAEIAPR